MLWMHVHQKWMQAYLDARMLKTFVFAFVHGKLLPPDQMEICWQENDEAIRRISSKSSPVKPNWTET